MNVAMVIPPESFLLVKIKNGCIYSLSNDTARGKLLVDDQVSMFVVGHSWALQKLSDEGNMIGIKYL